MADDNSDNYQAELDLIDQLFDVANRAEEALNDPEIEKAFKIVGNSSLDRLDASISNLSVAYKTWQDDMRSSDG